MTRSSIVEGLESRKLLAALTPDRDWGFDGNLTPESASNQPRDLGLTLLRATGDGLLVQSRRGGQSFFDRYNYDGTHDDRYTSTDIPESTPNAVPLLTADTLGRGIALEATLSNTLLVRRYRVDGTLDAAFGSNGLATLTLPEAFGDTYLVGNAQQIAAGPDGSIFLTSQAVTFDKNTTVGSDRYRAYLFKLAADGAIDTSFGDGGKVLVGGVSPNYLAVDPAGRVLVGTTPRADRQLITRYTAAGAIDSTFATNGVFRTGYAISLGYDVSPDIALDAQGRLLIAHSGAQVRLIRLDANGRYDAAFGAGGQIDTLGGSGDHQEVDGLITQSDGKIVLLVSHEGTPYLVRLAPDGTPDATFDGDGRADLLFAAEGKLLARLPDGSYLMSNDRAVRPTLQKLADFQPVQLGSTGTLFLRQFDTADRNDTVRITDTGTGLRLDLNGQITDYAAGAIKAIVAELGGGDNFFDSTLRVPTTVTGSYGSDTIFTGNADDLVYGNPPNDQALGAGSSDVIGTRGGRDRVIVGDGVNSIDLGTGGGSVSTYNGTAGPTTITGSSGDYTITIGGAAATITLAGNRANVYASTREGSTIDLSGMTGDTTVTGGPGADRIITGAGNDLVLPYGGNDTVFTGPGDDFVGADIELRSPTVPADQRNDYIDLGAGDDVVADAYGDNTILGGAGNDSIRTGTGDDSVFGDLGRDTIRGGAGNDTLDGGAHRDRIFGNAGNDSITGGSGDDTLVGDAGRDTLIGNKGNDLFVTRDSATDLVRGGDGADRGFVDEDDVGNVEALLDELA